MPVILNGDREWFCVHGEPPGSSLQHKKPLLPACEKLIEGICREMKLGQGRWGGGGVPSALGNLGKGRSEKVQATEWVGRRGGAIQGA